MTKDERELVEGMRTLGAHPRLLALIDRLARIEAAATNALASFDHHDVVTEAAIADLRAALQPEPTEKVDGK